MNRPPPERERRRFRVHGVVQGVGFRWWLSRHARQLRLAGWVRNLADGTVETEVEGAGEEVRRIQDLLRAGPPGATVRDVEELPAGREELPEAFTITR